MKLKGIMQRKDIHKVLFYIAVFVILELSGTVKVALENPNDISKKLSVLLIVLLLPLASRAFLKKKYMKKNFTVIILTVGYAIWNYFHYNPTFSSILMRLIWFLLFFMMCEYFKDIGLDIMKFIYDMTCILAAAGLVLYVLVVFFSINLPYTSFSISSINTYRSYLGMLTTSSFYAMDFFGLTIYRLHSIFWEPGVYQIFLNFALYYWVFKKPEKKIKELALILVSVFLTFSTTGYCVAAALVGWWLYSQKIFKRIKIIVAVPIVIVASVFVINTLNEKMTVGFGSYNARLSDMYIGWNLFLNNFWLGTGYDNTDIFMMSQGWGRGSSNGFITWCYTMGIFGVVLVLFPFLYNIFSEKEKEVKFKRVVFFLIFVLMNMSEPIYFAPIMWLFVAKEYSELTFRRKANAIEIKNTFYCT